MSLSQGTAALSGFVPSPGGGGGVGGRRGRARCQESRLSQRSCPPGGGCASGCTDAWAGDSSPGAGTSLLHRLAASPGLAAAPRRGHMTRPAPRLGQALLASGPQERGLCESNTPARGSPAGRQSPRAAEATGMRVTMSLGCTPTAAALRVCYLSTRRHALHSQTPLFIARPGTRSQGSERHPQPADATVYLPAVLSKGSPCGAVTVPVLVLAEVALPGRVAELVCRDLNPYWIPQQCTPGHLEDWPCGARRWGPPSPAESTGSSPHAPPSPHIRCDKGGSSASGGGSPFPVGER